MILFNGVKFEAKKFPIGETIIEKKWLSLYKKKDNNKFTLKYEGDHELFQLLLLRKSVWFPIDLEITYMPYSRMDRTSEDYVFTLKALGKYLNWLDFNQVYLYEPHSDVTPAIINKCRIKPLTVDLLYKTDFNIKEDFVLYPDATAHKRYSNIIKSDKELIGLKERNFNTGKILGMDIMMTGKNPFNKRVFIVDDLCSKGGTFSMAAEALSNLGVSDMFLVVAHCEPTIFKGDVLTGNLINKVYTTDTIPQKEKHDKLIIFNI